MIEAQLQSFKCRSMMEGNRMIGSELGTILLKKFPNHTVMFEVDDDVFAEADRVQECDTDPESLSKSLRMALGYSETSELVILSARSI
jgi:hypothetical protein